MQLINWLWLEDLLVDACEGEIRGFGRDHPETPFFAFCLEYDGLHGELELSYGDRRSVDAERSRIVAAGAGEGVQYRVLELRPDHWKHRAQRVEDPHGHWGRASRVLETYRAMIREDENSDTTEFLWLRFEYLAECVVRRLLERGAFRDLRREPEFIAYTANEHESLEELEDRLARFYPNYQRATMEFLPRPRVGEIVPFSCQRIGCRPGSLRQRLLRCTYCQRWFCGPCTAQHAHRGLQERSPLFLG